MYVGFLYLPTKLLWREADTNAGILHGQPGSSMILLVGFHWRPEHLCMHMLERSGAGSNDFAPGYDRSWS